MHLVKLSLNLLINKRDSKSETATMFIEKLYPVTINASNHKHFSKWFNELKCGQIIYSTIDKLLKNSRTEIEIQCDACEILKSIKYRDYNKYGYLDGAYFCKKCKLEKNNLEKWGVKNVFQSKIVKDKIKNTLLKKYDVDNISKNESIKIKKKQTNKAKYGVDYPQQSSVIKAKTSETLKRKWGVENISQSEEIKSKKKKTYYNKTGYDFIFNNPEFLLSQIESNIIKYGVSYSFCAETVKQKIAKTNLTRWGNTIASKNDLIKSKIKKNVTLTLNSKTFEKITNLISIDSDKRLFKINCDFCLSQYEISWMLFYKRRETKTVICTTCNPIDKHQSGLEIDLYNFIKSIYLGDIKQNYKINQKELDIFITEKNIAFEFNGLYWHSELFKPRNYHLEKTKICKNNDIRLFHIWEDDWLYNRQIVESMISNKLGLTKFKFPARKCKVLVIKDNKLVMDFLTDNHIQGKTVFSKAIGLYYNDELLSVMTFIKRKKEWELNRFCTKLNCLAVGGASKLLKYFINNNSVDIYTFSDNSYSSGELYENIGFKKDYDLKPDYSYLDSGIRCHKFNYRKKSTSGLVKVWDAGKIKFKF